MFEEREVGERQQTLHVMAVCVQHSVELELQHCLA
jgi:hypothetical protein